MQKIGFQKRETRERKEQKRKEEERKMRVSRVVSWLLTIIRSSYQLYLLGPKLLILLRMLSKDKYNHFHLEFPLIFSPIMEEFIGADFNVLLDKFGRV